MKIAQIKAVGTKIIEQKKLNIEMINPKISPFNEKSLVSKFKDEMIMNSSSPSNVRVTI